MTPPDDYSANIPCAFWLFFFALAVAWALLQFLQPIEERTMAKQPRSGKLAGAPAPRGGAAPEEIEPTGGSVRSFQVESQPEGLILGLVLDTGERIVLRIDSGTGWQLSQRLGVASARAAHELTDDGGLPQAVRAVETDPRAAETLRNELSKAQGSPEYARAGASRQERANAIARLSAEQEARDKAAR